MRNNEIFPLSMKYLEPDDEFFDQMQAIIASRVQYTGYPFLTFLKRMGNLASSIMDEEDDEDSMYKNLLMVHFAMLANFIYPMHEQLDAVIENHLKISLPDED